MPENLSGSLYKAPQQVDKFVSQYPELKAIAEQPAGVWLGGWSGDVGAAVSKMVKDAAGKTLLLVAYNIPNRDLGSYSAGGVDGPDAYYGWIGAIGAAIGNAPAIVILEPDAMGHLHAMEEPAKGQRLTMLSVACDILNKQPNVNVYIDLSMWVSPDLTAQSLTWSDIVNKVAGFACNVSGYKPLHDVKHWANQVSSLTKLPYVVDTSRNGQGTAGEEWCNPKAQGLGIVPQIIGGGSNMFAALWIKAPGESDGECNGGPRAGEFYVQQALQLVKSRFVEFPTATPVSSSPMPQAPAEPAAEPIHLLWTVVNDLAARVLNLETLAGMVAPEPLPTVEGPATVPTWEAPLPDKCEKYIASIAHLKTLAAKRGDEHKILVEINDYLKSL